MTPAEHRLLVLALAWILASIPLAVLVWQIWFRRQRPVVHPVIPHEDAGPAGSFLDVALPPPLPEMPGRGLPVRHWKALDGWVALGLVAVLSWLMGPLSLDPAKAAAFQASPEILVSQIIFQAGFVGLLGAYLTMARGLRPVQVFGLNRQPLWAVPCWALLWIIPGTVLIGVINALTLPQLLEWLGQSEASPQMMIQALQKTPDGLVKGLTYLTVAVGAPLMEELVFRGFLYGVAKRFTHWSYAALGSSLFFAVVHGNVMSFLPLTLLGLLFTAAYEQTKNLLVPAVMHACFNGFQVTVLFFFPEIVQQIEKS